MIRLSRLLTVALLILTSANFVHAQKQFKALMITTTKGWHHTSLHAGVLAIQDMAIQNNFDVTLLENPNGITDKILEDYQVIILLNTTGDIFTDEQQKSIEKFIQSGKGYVGIHSASDTEYDWAWYTKLVGRMFVTHPSIQTAKLEVYDNKFPGLQSFEAGKLWTEEYYQFGPELVTDLHYVLGVDERSYQPKGDGMGTKHPLAWYHNYDGGRSFYTALGHMPSDFTNQAFLDHVFAGIFWAATGKK